MSHAQQCTTDAPCFHRPSGAASDTCHDIAAERASLCGADRTSLADFRQRANALHVWAKQPDTPIRRAEPQNRSPRDECSAEWHHGCADTARRARPARAHSRKAKNRELFPDCVHTPHSSLRLRAPRLGVGLLLREKRACARLGLAPLGLLLRLATHRHGPPPIGRRGPQTAAR